MSVARGAAQIAEIRSLAVAQRAAFPASALHAHGDVCASLLAFLLGYLGGVDEAAWAAAVETVKASLPNGAPA